MHFDNYNLHCVISIHALLAESDVVTVLETGGSRYFYPRSPCGERRFVRCRFWVLSNISIHALLAESDPSVLHSFRPLQISIHALLAESDGSPYHRLWKGSEQFLSTLSLRRATLVLVFMICLLPDFYPRSPCGERRGFDASRPKNSQISIHALLAESDAYPDMIICTNVISIHALLAESDGQHVICLVSFRRFLSTLSLRRATPPSVT